MNLFRERFASIDSQLAVAHAALVKCVKGAVLEPRELENAAEMIIRAREQISDLRDESDHN